MVIDCSKIIIYPAVIIGVILSPIIVPTYFVYKKCTKKDDPPVDIEMAQVNQVEDRGFKQDVKELQNYIKETFTNVSSKKEEIKQKKDLEEDNGFTIVDNV